LREAAFEPMQQHQQAAEECQLRWRSGFYRHCLWYEAHSWHGSERHTNIMEVLYIAYHWVGRWGDDVFVGLHPKIAQQSNIWRPIFVVSCTCSQHLRAAYVTGVCYHLIINMCDQVFDRVFDRYRTTATVLPTAKFPTTHCCHVMSKFR
jgi:hypothetical protein